MTIIKTVLALALGALLCAPPVAASGAQSSPQAARGMPPMPKPGPEHELFKEDAGTWDAVVESFMAPGAPPMTSKGVETNTIGCSGLCLITDFKGEMMPGTSFEGHGTATGEPDRRLESVRRIRAAPAPLSARSAAAPSPFR